MLHYVVFFRQLAGGLEVPRHLPAAARWRAVLGLQDLLEAAVVHHCLADVDQHAILAERVLETRLRPASPLHLQRSI